MWHVTISYGVLFRKLYMPALHRYWEEHTNSTEAKNDNSCFQLEGVCDVVLYLAREVWCVPSWFHHLLCCGKLLGQNTLEAFLDNYICGKLDVVLREDYVVDIIHLLRDALFFDEDPPRYVVLSTTNAAS